MELNNNNNKTNTNNKNNNNNTNATNSIRAEWKTQLVIKINFISVKDFENT